MSNARTVKPPSGSRVKKTPTRGATRTTPSPEAPPARARTSAPLQTTLPFQVPFLDGQYVASRAFLRSAIFGVEKKGRRQLFHDAPVASRDGLVIRFSGQALDQHDHDAFMVMVREARAHGMGLNVHFTLRSFLEELDWGYGGKAIARLRAVFTRLVTAAVHIELPGGAKWEGHLVEEVLSSPSFDGSGAADGQYFFRLSPKMATWLSVENVAYLAIRNRKQLKSMLAKWIHGFLESDLKAFPARIDDLWELSRSSCAQRYQFLRQLRHALEDLKACTIIADWRMDREFVYITRLPAQVEERQKVAAAR
jgi:hypothetical protein